MISKHNGQRHTHKVTFTLSGSRTTGLALVAAAQRVLAAQLQALPKVSRTKGRKPHKRRNVCLDRFVQSQQVLKNPFRRQQKEPQNFRIGSLFTLWFTAL